MAVAMVLGGLRAGVSAVGAPDGRRTAAAGLGAHHVGTNASPAAAALTHSSTRLPSSYAASPTSATWRRHVWRLTRRLAGSMPAQPGAGRQQGHTRLVYQPHSADRVRLG